MKVMQILPEFSAGGVELCVLELAQALVAAGHTSLVVSNGGGLGSQLEREGSRHIRLPVHRKSPISLLQVWCLRRLLRKERPHILHYHSRVPGWIAYLAWLSLRPSLRPRLVSTMHGFHSVSPYSAVMTKGERVIAVSQSMRSYLLQNYPATSPERIRVVYPGLDPRRYERHTLLASADAVAFEVAYPLPPGGWRLILPGRITRLKGHHDFLWLLAALQRRGFAVQGLVVGSVHPRKQAYSQELYAAVDALKLRGSVHFLGPRSDLPVLMAASHLVLSLSQQPESFGRTVLESLALSTPVAGYAYGGAGELLNCLYPQGRVLPKDRSDLLRVVEDLLFDPPAAPHLNGLFTFPQMLAGHLQLYEQLLSVPLRISSLD